MSISRYLSNNPFSPQPTHRISLSSTDILHNLKMGERLDNLAYKYYNDPLLSWIILAANPVYDNEFEIPFGVTIRIPFPLQRVLDGWLINNEI